MKSDSEQHRRARTQRNACAAAVLVIIGAGCGGSTAKSTSPSATTSTTTNTFTCPDGSVPISFPPPTVKPFAYECDSAETDSVPGRLTGRQVLAIIERSAANTGDAHPTKVQWVATTRGTGFALIGEPQPSGGTDLDHAVFFIQASGRFTINNAPGPNRGGAPRAAPQGSCLQITIDSTTGQELDGGVSGKCADFRGMRGVHTVG